MSQVTEQSVRFQTALASIKLIQASAVLDLTEDDFDFLTSNKVWIATDRSRARRCVEACVYADNGDMYVDGHKAASDVRDEFVSVTEKLMDELAQCYNVLPQLDINNTIDHRPEGDEKWFLENEKTVTQFCRKLAAERPLKDIRDEYNYPKKKGIKDE